MNKKLKLMKTGNDDYDDDTVDENVFFFVNATKIGKNLYPSFELKITKNNLLHKCFFYLRFENDMST